MTTTRRLATILNADVVGYSHLMCAEDQGTLILAAVQRLTADGSGYRGLITAGEEGVLERLKAYRREILEPRISEHGGRILTTDSNGMVVEFGDPAEAVRCAVEMQQRIVERNAETAEHKRITFRVGLDLVTASRNEAISVSARLRALAEPGGVCISRSTREAISNGLASKFEDIGRHQFEAITAPVQAFAMGADALAPTPGVAAPAVSTLKQHWLYPRSAVIAAGVAVVVGIWTVSWWSWRGRDQARLATQETAATNSSAARAVDVVHNAAPQTPPAPSPSSAPPQAAIQTEAPPASVPAPSSSPASAEAQTRASASDQPRSSEPVSSAARSAPFSIVVLPFANLSKEPGQQYFADGITDQLTSDLSRFSDAFVIARNTAFAYGDKSIDAKLVGRELGVRYVLQGSVRRDDDEVSIGARAIDVEDGRQVWAERLESNRAELVEARKELAVRLARALGVELGEASTPISDQEAVTDAGDLVMRGWGWYYQPYSSATWQEARRDFEQALDIDPRSVDARIGLATILGGRLADGWTASLQLDAGRAEKLLDEALERDANRPAAHFAMGVLRQMQNRLPEAQAEYEATLALDRNHARAHLHLGQTLMFLGQPEAGIPQIETAIRLDPRNPNMSTAYWALGACYLLQGQVDEAADLLTKAREANSRLWFAHLYLAGAFGLQGNVDEAQTALTESIKLKPAVNSVARMRMQNPWLDNPQYWALQEKTLNVGLRLAGLPDQ
jgi:adenylate cyclase